LLEEKQKEFAAELSNAKQALSSSLTAQFQEKITQKQMKWQREREEEVNQSAAEAQKQLDSEVRKQEELGRTISKLRVQIVELERNEAELKSFHESELAAWVKQRTQLKQSHQSEIFNLSAVHQQVVDQLNQDNNSRAIEQRAEHEARLDSLQSALSALQEEYNRLAERYKNRESRPEDIKKIGVLEVEIIKLKEAKAALENELKYYRLELINREENYNKTFGRSPAVGNIMNLSTANNYNNGSTSKASSKGKAATPSNYETKENQFAFTINSSGNNAKKK
jgi:chromosome segregation ATPase